MAKMTPSKEKMRLARRFAAELQKCMGANLKTVFVYGSVAANMAVPKSDIDIMVVCDDEEQARKTFNKMPRNLWNKLHESVTKKNIQLSMLGKRFFEDNLLPEDMFTKHINEPKVGSLRQGAIPILGKGYAQEYRNSWNFPRRTTIVKYSLEKYEKATMESRLKYKRRKTSRGPRIQRK